jgi:hypothetical protein
MGAAMRGLITITAILFLLKELKDQTGEVVKTFRTKTEALAGGRLEQMLGNNGDTVL